jgi:hypothetical protein
LGERPAQGVDGEVRRRRSGLHADRPLWGLSGSLDPLDRRVESLQRRYGGQETQSGPGGVELRRRKHVPAARRALLRLREHGWRSLGFAGGARGGWVQGGPWAVFIGRRSALGVRARAGNHGEIPGRELRCAGETDLSGGPGGAARRGGERVRATRLRLTGGPSAGRWAEASARREGRVTCVACERATARVRAGPGERRCWLGRLRLGGGGSGPLRVGLGRVGRGRWDGPRARLGVGFWVCFLFSFLFLFLSFLNLIQTKFKFKFEFEFKPHSNKSMHQHERNKKFKPMINFN